MTKWTVYWNEYCADTYLYGSQISYHKKDDVEYKNLLMPPGTIIKKWYSKTNFQMQKIEPALPMIDGESEYQLIINIDCEEGENCLVRLVFYDRYEVEAGSITCREKIMNFKCPLKTYSYQMHLINGGVSEFHFHSIVIREISDGTKKVFKKTE